MTTAFALWVTIGLLHGLWLMRGLRNPYLRAAFRETIPNVMPQYTFAFLLSAFFVFAMLLGPLLFVAFALFRNNQISEELTKEMAYQMHKRRQS